MPEGVRNLLKQRIGNGLELPFQSTTSAQVLALCNDDQCDAQKLSELIQLDQALAGHVLGIANSAVYAPVEPIVSLKQAVSRLGISTICSIAVAVSLKGRVFDVPGHAVTIREMWIHSSTAAVYAKEVARLLRTNVEGAFLCGLLHDVGKPIVLQNLVDAAREKTDKPVPMGILEAAMFEFHEYVGSLMVASWELPAWITDVVAHHHRYHHAEERVREAMIVNLADRLSHWALSDSNDESDFEMSDPVLEGLNLYRDDVEKLLRMRGMVIEVAEVFL